MPPLKALEEAGFIVTADAIAPKFVKRSKRRSEANAQPSMEIPSCIDIASEFERLSAELVLNDERIDILN